MIERMRWNSNFVKSIRDTEQKPNSPPTSGSPIALAFDHFTKLALRKVFYTQILKNALECF
ncbi:hypothetical protein B4917_06985 [Helicobacter pylori]|nr:hypothetical protein BW246_05960 [Helicobacter pylori]ORJ07660.1 hypothetical protein B4U47_06770 [Helicobacter pylori]ORJ09117.1 hypothetical protein B4917_06985 [Helicobacter pylori]OUJ19769.1 hypothetical protein BZL55_07850 [Helicobacter pylori]